MRDCCAEYAACDESFIFSIDMPIESTEIIAMTTSISMSVNPVLWERII